MDHTKVTHQTFNSGAEMVMAINKRTEEIDWLGEQREVYAKLDATNATNEARRNAPANGIDPRTYAPPANPFPGAAPIKNWTARLMESPVFEAAKNKAANVRAEIEGAPLNAIGVRPLNATFLTSSGWAPESLRTGRVVLDEQREIEVTDMIPVFPTTMAAIVYMEETTFTNAAAERSENAAYAEATLILTQRSVTVRSIGDSLPVTDEQLADVDGVGAYLDQRLGFMVRQRLDSQILVGDGIAPNLAGTLNVAGINSQAKGADNVPDAFYKGMVAVRVTGRAQPSVCFVHPSDWQDVRLLKTADGIYVYGSPADVAPARLWGVPVVETTAVTQNTGIVGDYARYSGLHMRTGLEVATGFVNDDFTKGRVTIRAGVRCAVVHYRPTAFTQVTGI